MSIGVALPHTGGPTHNLFDKDIILVLFARLGAHKIQESQHVQNVGQHYKHGQRLECWFLTWWAWSVEKNPLHIVPQQMQIDMTSKI